MYTFLIGSINIFSDCAKPEGHSVNKPKSCPPEGYSLVGERKSEQDKKNIDVWGRGPREKNEVGKGG